jgi:hypothetical protein
MFEDREVAQMPGTAILYGRAPVVVEPDGEALWIETSALPMASGWELKPEGVCRDDVCVPIPPARGAEFVRDGWFNIAAFARHLNQPVIHSPESDAWVIGEAAPQRQARLQGPARDFELPDISGEIHRLSDHRGKKVLLVTWGSW